MSHGWASVSFEIFGNSKSKGPLPGTSRFLAEAVFSVVVGSGSCHPQSSSLPWFLEKGQFGLHPNFSVLGLMIDCSSVLGSPFMGGFWAGNTGHVFAVVIQVIRREATNFFPWRGFLTSFQHLGHGVLSWTGAFPKGGGLFYEASVWVFALVGALEVVVGGCMVVSLGLGAVLGLNLLVGTALFLYSMALSFLTFGFGSSWGGLY